MGSDPYIGEIIMFAGNYAPEGWLPCDGRSLPIAQYQALFAIIGTFYGGDGRTTFALPDLRGRMPVGMGWGQGLTQRDIGQLGGAESVTLTQNELPTHSHALAGQLGGSMSAKFNLMGDAGKSDNPAGAYLASHSNAFLKAGTNKVQLNAESVSVDSSGLTLPPATAPAGNGQGHQNMPPFQVMNFIIAWSGIFPPRP